jgi:hypothetical protein
VRRLTRLSVLGRLHQTGAVDLDELDDLAQDALDRAGHLVGVKPEHGGRQVAREAVERGQGFLVCVGVGRAAERVACGNHAGHQ